MADYASRIASADVPKVVSDVRSTLDALSTVALTALNDNDPGVTDRVHVLLDHCIVIAETARPELVPSSAIDELLLRLARLRESIAACTSWEDGMPVGLLQTVTDLAEQLAEEIWTWNGHATDWRETVSAAATGFRRSVGQGYGPIRAEVESIEATLAQAKAGAEQLAQQIDELDTEANDRLGAVESASTERDEAAAAGLKSLTERLDQSIARWETQFSDAQERRLTAHRELLDALESSGNEAIETQAARAKGAVDAIEKLRDQTRDMVSVFAGAGTAHAYGKEARDEAKAANAWRFVAVSGLVLAALAAAWLVHATSTQTHISTAEVIGKLSLSLVLAGAASYAATQSAHHRRRSNHARDLELRLVTFRPVIDELGAENDAVRLALQQELIQHVFIQPQDTNAEAIASLNSAQIGLLSQVADIIKKAAK